MNLIVKQSDKLNGSITVPPSKSHTHRAIILSSIANGTSVINNPLMAKDCIATIDACKSIGASIHNEASDIVIKGINGFVRPSLKTIDVGNSGTTLRFMSAIVALGIKTVVLTGDTSIQQRPIEPLITCLNDLGAKAMTVHNNGKPPVSITGMIKGGETTIDGISSQFLSGLLIACCLSYKDTIIHVNNLKSKPYVDMTLQYLKKSGIKIENHEYKKFHIFGGQQILPQTYVIPGDFSSAAYLFAAAYITSSHIQIEGLDFNDTQGDKKILSIIESLKHNESREIDLADTPDLLPIVAVLACYGNGLTTIVNTSHARLKESDRIAAIASELLKMNAAIKETNDGLVIESSQLIGTKVNGHKDHRIVMALAIAGLRAKGVTEITDAETISISYPSFIESMQQLQANMKLVET